MALFDYRCDIVLSLYKEAAATGAPAPTNTQLRLALDKSAKYDTVLACIKALRANGSINVEYGANGNTKRVFVPHYGWTDFSLIGRAATAA